MTPTRSQEKKASRFALRGRHLLAADVACVAVAFVLSFALRLDVPSRALPLFLQQYIWLVLPLIAIRVGINMNFRLYQRLWRYASVDEMQAIVAATLAGSVVFGLLVLGLSYGGPDWPAYGFPRSIVAIEWLVSTGLLGGSRFSLRVINAARWVNGRRFYAGSGTGLTKRVIVVGAGDAGAAVVKELLQRPALAMEPTGFVDDDPTKKDHWLHGVQVLGSRTELPSLVEQLGADGVIVAMPSAPGTAIREIMQTCKGIGVEVMTVPGIAELISGKVAYSQIRPVQVDDLLRREAASLDMDAIAGFLRGATVMVTGAGGSIGSELCRQVLAFQPGRLLLLGRGENSIYQIHGELLGDGTGRRGDGETRGREDAGTELVPIIADVRDMPRLKAIMGEYRPSVVFHAAAHKHVPLMEANPSEAIATNVLGTWNLLQASAEVGVETFVQVSTDKAVNPTNVMGASKRIGELLLQQTAARTGRRYVAVRFGNVLGSRGSVVPLFKRQIEAGGPLTVTHPEVTRYFMTIPEAVQLIIQAAAMGEGGEIFVLDMGQPIRIYDLALDLIRLSGLEPFRDIDIEITGLRPGEKMYEELFTASEQRIATRNSRIFVSSLQRYREDHLEEGLRDLGGLVAAGACDGAALREAVRRLVPEFADEGVRGRGVGRPGTGTG